jgi:hypothetical protein
MHATLACHAVLLCFAALLCTLLIWGLKVELEGLGFEGGTRHWQAVRVASEECVRGG